jgi:RND family efflux transporter MFP subunit
MLRKKAFWIVLLVLALVGGGGYVAYARGLIPWLAPQETGTEETTLETATVTTGDLSITADGSGQLVPSAEVELAFDSAGTLTALLVEVGDVVQAGDVLGWIDDTDARNAVAEAELSLLQAQQALTDAGDTAQLEQAVAKAALTVAQTEASLAEARDALADLTDWAPDEQDVTVAQANLAIARASYQNTVAKADMWDEQQISNRVSLEKAVRNLEEAQANYANAMDAARDWERNIESTRERAAESLQDARDSLEIAQASYDLAQIDTRQIDIQNARIRVLEAEQTLEDLQTAPEEHEITDARIAVQELEVALRQAELDHSDAEKALAEASTAEAELSLQQAKLKLESAQEALDGTTLVAPMSGTVTEVLAEVGEKVNGTVVVLADLDEPMVQFWVEESDMNNVAVGHPVRLVFEALPDLTYEGLVVSIDPVLVTVGNTPAVQAWASIDTTSNPVTLLGDMNVEVEIVAGEALNALLVPVQALREVSEGQYAVFVVQPNGELEMRMVEIGLKDYVNAEVRAGLRRGEVVSLGEKTTSSSVEDSTDENPFRSGPGGGGMPPFFGG